MPEVSGQENEGEVNEVKVFSDAERSEEQLQLLWSLWQAQQALQQEDELLQHAETVQEEVLKHSESLRHEIQEAELAVESPSLRRPVSPSSAEEENHDAIQAAVLRHEKLTVALQQAEDQLQAKASAASTHEDVDENLAEQLESLEAELNTYHKRVRGAKQAQDTLRQELQNELQLQEARGRDERWQLRQELTEAYIETELLHSEIEAERKRREAMLQRLREEERSLVAQVNKASEDEAADVASRSSYWSGSICSDWSEVTRARAALEPVDISTPREVQVSASPDERKSGGLATPTSLLHELRGSRRGRTRTSLAGYHSTSSPASPATTVTATESPCVRSPPSRAEGSRRTKGRCSVAAFRSLEINKVENHKDSTGPRLSVIDEGTIPVQAKSRIASGEGESGINSDTSMGVRPPKSAEQCRGVLEWVVRGEDEEGLPDLWEGPGLFQVDPGRGDRQGRLFFRLFALFSTAEELSIPLLSISSVRLYAQDPLGMVFAIRYKAEKNQRFVALFRAASSESRIAWVSNLCEAIRDARNEVSGR